VPRPQRQQSRAEKPGITVNRYIADAAELAAARAEGGRGRRRSPDFRRCASGVPPSSSTNSSSPTGNSGAAKAFLRAPVGEPPAYSRMAAHGRRRAGNHVIDAARRAIGYRRRRTPGCRFRRLVDARCLMTTSMTKQRIGPRRHVTDTGPAAQQFVHLNGAAYAPPSCRGRSSERFWPSRPVRSAA